MNADVYLKIKEHRLILRNAAFLLPEVIVQIDMTKVQVHQAIKFGKSTKAEAG